MCVCEGGLEPVAQRDFGGNTLYVCVLRGGDCSSGCGGATEG